MTQDLSNTLVVFDLDGTLADSAHDLIATLNVILAREGLPAVSYADAINMVGSGARALLRRGFAHGQRDLDEATTERLFADFIAYYEAHVCIETKLYPGVVAALDHLEGAGAQFAVCTNKTERLAHALLRDLGIHHRFLAVCGQDTFDVSKPNPRALTQTIAKAGGNPARAIMVGDSRTDIDTAKAAGIPVVAVDFGYTDTPVSALGPDRVISHFDALAAAVASLRALQEA